MNFFRLATPILLTTMKWRFHWCIYHNGFFNIKGHENSRMTSRVYPFPVLSPQVLFFSRHFWSDYKSVTNKLSYDVSIINTFSISILIWLGNAPGNCEKCSRVPRWHWTFFYDLYPYLHESIIKNCRYASSRLAQILGFGHRTIGPKIWGTLIWNFLSVSNL